MASLRSAVAACATILSLLTFAGGAEAATIYTYSFRQDGYLGTVGVTAALTGTFSATVESDGSIQQADLIDFTYNFKTLLLFASAIGGLGLLHWRRARLLSLATA